MNPTIGDTIAAISTASGQAAIAMVRISGPEAISIVSEHFDGKDLMSAKPYSMHFGVFKDGDDLIDEVMVGLFKSPNSYTGEDTVEVSTHGSDFIARRVLECLLQGGARLAEPGEFTMRAFVNGKMDLSQAESVGDLIAAQSSASHRLALTQLRGGISSEISKLREQLINFASLLELELDFAEEDVEFANRDQLKDLVAQVSQVVGQLINSFSLGNAMKNGVTTVIAGRPNAGKSTLLNAMLGDDRAIVSDIEGTTRDTIEEVLVINGIAFRLVDTAGIREAQDKIEAIGVERTMQKVGESAVVMYVYDTVKMSKDEVNDDLARLEKVAGHNSILVVANKMDWNPYTTVEEWVGDHLTDDQFIPVSAKNNMNIEYLKERLVGMVDDGTIDPSQQIISSVRHVNALRKVDESLVAVENGFAEQVTSDFIAMDMRQALHWLGEITGEVSTDDILGNIFSKFCIGK